MGILSKVLQDSSTGSVLGVINIAADFPTLAQVTNGATYVIGTAVTDNDPTKTNTGSSFVEGEVIAWDEADTKWITTSVSAPVQSVAGKTGTVTLVAADVGLGNVDNTSDADKPISTATQTALDGKENTLGFTPENVANKAVDFSTVNDTLYPSVEAVNEQLALKLDVADNLNDLADAATARTNLDLGDLAVADSVSENEIDNNAVTNIKLANMDAGTIKGRQTGNGQAQDLTATQATSILDNMVGDSGGGGTKGLVPAPAAGDAAADKFLKADGTWSAEIGSGDVTGPALSGPNYIPSFSDTTGKVLQVSGMQADVAGNILAASVSSAGTIQGSTLLATNLTSAKFITSNANNELISAVKGAVDTFDDTASGDSYVPGDYINVPLTGGSGTGLEVNITVIPGEGIKTVDTLVGGADYTDGTYSAVSLTGGTGEDALADITVAGGAVTVVTIVGAGNSYAVDDTLSADPADIGGTGAGFTVDVATIFPAGLVGFPLVIAEEGQDYVEGDVLGVDNANLGGTGSGFEATVGTIFKPAVLTIDDLAPGEDGNVVYSPYATITTGPQTLVDKWRYFANSASQLTFPLPTTAAVGDVFRIIQANTGGYKITQNAGQIIYFQGGSTTAGTGGFLESAGPGSVIELTCIESNTAFIVTSHEVNPTLT